VRTDRWRYIDWNAGTKSVQLFDEENDPGETKNLADDPGHAATVADLKKLIPSTAIAPYLSSVRTPSEGAVLRLSPATSLLHPKECT
jgi:arylsulfatase A-like enzyme